jgi:hypothetical protein
MHAEVVLGAQQFETPLILDHDDAVGDYSDVDDENDASRSARCMNDFHYEAAHTTPQIPWIRRVILISERARSYHSFGGYRVVLSLRPRALDGSASHYSNQKNWVTEKAKGITRNRSTPV